MPPVEPQTYPKVPQRFFDDVVKMTPLEIAGDITIVISAAKTMNYKASGLFEVSFGSNAIANSKGLFAFDKSTSVEYSTTIHGPKGSGSHSAFGESRKQVDAKELAQIALTTAISAQNPADIEPGDYTVIFEPAAVLDLLEFLPYDMNARDADEGTTYFSGKVGEKMFPDKLNIYTEIFNPMLPGKHFGEDGLAGKRIDWVKKGVLERLRHERFWAKEKGVEPDPAIFPLYMDGEDRSLEDLIKSCTDGLLVKRFWYIRYVDRREYLLTGMTRDGFFRILDGKIVGAVKNLRFNESPIILLKNITGMSRPKRVLSYAVVPGIMSENFTFSSKTESL
jgi:predicted Zn-dependent protease